MTRPEKIFISAITALGAALRLFQIGAQSLWLDELFSVFLSRRDFAQIVSGTAQDTMPPLYYLLLHIALQLGSDETAARAISFLFSVATIPLFYQFTRELFNARVAVFVVLLLVLNPLHIFYAQEARMYTMLTFFVLAAIYSFLHAWRNKSARAWIWFGIFQALAFYTHSMAFLNLVPIDIFVLTQPHFLRQCWRGLVTAHLILFALFIPWLFVFFQQANRVQQGFWGVPPSPSVLLSTMYLFLFGSALPVFAVPLALYAALALLIFALIAWIRTIRLGQADADALSFAVCLFLIPPVSLYLLSLVRPIYVERAVLPSSLGLYLLFAWSFARAEPQILNKVLGIATILLMIFALVYYYFEPSEYKPQTRLAASVLAEQFQPTDVIAHTSDSSALAFSYYKPSLPNHFLLGDPDYAATTTRGQSGRIAGLVPEELNRIVVGHARLWLIVMLDHNLEYQKERVAELEARYHRVNEQSVAGIVMLLFNLED